MKNKDYKRLSIKEFSKAANKYEGNHAGIYKMCRKDYPDVLDELEKEPFTDLLDCGCGTAPMLTLLHDRHPDRHFTGIDLTPKMIEVARSKRMEGVELVVGDCENLPFPEDSFDVVICCQSFHHYPNVQDFFNSVYRVLRPGGRLILRDMTMDTAAVRWFCNHIELPLANLTGHGDVRVYGKDEVDALCRKAGLKMELFEKRAFCRMHCVARKEKIIKGHEDTIMELKLGDIQTTAIIPLAIKASETLRPDARIKDPKAVEIIKTLNVDTKPYDKFLSHEGVVARTIMLDRQMKRIIRKAPDTVVVNIGAGFDNRFSRVDNGKIWWFDLDLPDAIEVRKKAFKEQDRVTMIAGDALEDVWCGQVKEKLKGRKAKPVFIAEGLFMYLTLDQIRTLLKVLKNNFPDGGILIAEQNNKLMQKNEKHHDTVKSTNARFLSGTDTAQEIADLTDGIRLIEEHSFNEEMKKYSIRGKLFALLLPKMNDRWATFMWGRK